MGTLGNVADYFKAVFDKLNVTFVAKNFNIGIWS